MKRFIRWSICAVLILFLILSIKGNCIAANTYAMPDNSGVKTYMDYRTITNKASAQYKLQQEAYTDELGLRKVEDRYCVAVGSYFNAPIGTKIDVLLSSGTTLKCIIGDAKNDAHTDSKNLKGHNGNIVEFIVDSHVMDTAARRSGDISILDGFGGKIKQVVVYKDDTEITEVTKPAVSIEVVKVNDVKQQQADTESTVDASTVDAIEEVFETVPEEIFVTYNTEAGLGLQ